MTLERMDRRLAAGDNGPVDSVKAVDAAAEPVQPDPESTSAGPAGGLLQEYVSEQVEAIVRGAAALRAGDDAVHPTRVATRRLRSVLRVFAALFHADALTFDAELAWYAGVLGAVRERQVLRARLAAIGTAAEAEAEATASEAASLTALQQALAVIDARLHDEEDGSRHELLAALDGERYGALVRTLTHWQSSPPLAPAAEGDAAQLRRFVRAAGRAADKRLARSTAQQHDADALHRARKAAKRARYAAEVARSVLGEKAARSSLDHYKAVQEALGEHQDSADAVSLLARLRAEAADTDPELTAAYDVLLEREAAAARTALSQAVALAP